ncbi:MAG: hypothetical protein MN733_43305, partial [Nitrososphaera sp.]|nr:hypothetical protein [Nitrososphaera sp.]
MAQAVDDYRNVTIRIMLGCDMFPMLVVEGMGDTIKRDFTNRGDAYIFAAGVECACSAMGIQSRLITDYSTYQTREK